MSFVDFSLMTINNAFAILSSWLNRTKKPMDLKEESKDFKRNGTIIFSWLVEFYSDDINKLHTTFEIVIFIRALEREVITALMMILDLKI